MRRRSHGSVIAAPLLAVLFAGCTSSAIESSASPATVTQPPTASTLAVTAPPTVPDSSGSQLTAKRDGFTLAVTLDRNAVAPGDEVAFIATFHNGTATPTDYAMPSCSVATSIVMSVALPVEPKGKAWSGIAGVFKDYALKEGFGPGGVPALAPVSVDLRANPCNEGEFEGILDPGQSVTSSMSWPAEIVAGVPAMAGKVPFTVSVGYEREDEPPAPSSDSTGPRRSVILHYKQLVVNGSVEVVGDRPRVVTAGEAVDALLENGKFATWLAAQPRRTWSNANLFLSSAPKAEGIVPNGPSWDIELFPDLDAPRHWAIAFVDPFDASVRSVTYCDVPCDR